jgi:DNA modification methylase
MTPTSEVHIKPAKGRPMLTWVGKRPLRNLTAYPAQLVETYQAAPEVANPIPEIWQDWPAAYPQGGLLFHGDNKEVLAHLLANGFRGKIKLIYIDPPFDSGADYIRKINLRGLSGLAKVNGEDFILGEQIQYTDIWANDNYLQFMYERLLMLKELLSEDGNIWLHCDWHKSHHLRCLMDEVFGSEHIQNEIIWKRTSARSDSKTFNHIHDTLLFYSKGGEYQWNKLLLPQPEEYLDRYFSYKDNNGRRFMALNLTAPGVRKGSTGLPWKGFDPNTQNNHWKYTIEKLNQLDTDSDIYWPEKEGGWPRLKKYLDENEGRAIQSIWDDVYTVNSQASERTDYPTQKPESILDRIIESSSIQGDLILDCFIGSGTTAAVAQKLCRRWIGCDINKGAIQTSSKRMQAIMQEQAAALLEKSPKNLSFFPSDTNPEDDQPKPAQLSFAVYRVNDYDLQIQHNEAVNLACEHIGITRTKTDAFFDGTLGKRLVKIIPFNHPLTPLDLEEVKKELGNRPEESRDMVVVCLGKELAVEAWLEDWNRLRKQADFPNKIEVIELRSDTRYGGFFTHQPAQGQVDIRRTAKGIEVDIQTFISPTIVERLKQQAGLLSPQIEDWRAMVDSVMIDPAYDGQVFNVVLADVPEKKSDLVSGKYVLDAPPGQTSVAVKITDMLGEEILVVQTV